MIIRRNFNIYLGIFLSSISFLRGQINNTFDVILNSAEETLVVSQTIEYTNTSNRALSTLYFYDWANSYQGEPAPLAKHLANQFNRSFYIRSNSKLGYTKINILEGASISSWSRLENQLDIIAVKLHEKLSIGGQIKIQLEYLVKIPDDKFSGIGINSSNGFLIRDLFISIAPRYNGEWLLNSNLGFRDYSNQPSNYQFNWKFPNNYTLLSNLNEISSDTDLKRITKPPFIKMKTLLVLNLFLT